METKKGNTIVISILIIFIFSLFIACIYLTNMTLNKQINNLTVQLNKERTIEINAYEFYVQNIAENELFYLENNVIYYKSDNNVKFEMYIENNVLNIRRIN